MKKKVIINLTFFLMTVFSIYGQFGSQILNTDSTNIEIIRNTEYQIYEETYKNRDSVWYSVHFIKDTTRLNIEGWKRKNGTRFGVWKEYNYDQLLLYTWDYDKGICKVNKDLYPYHDILEKMKSIYEWDDLSGYNTELLPDND